MRFISFLKTRLRIRFPIALIGLAVLAVPAIAFAQAAAASPTSIDPAQIAITVFTFLASPPAWVASLPYVGPVLTFVQHWLVIILAAIAGLGGVATAIVGLWHGFDKLVAALAVLFPGLGNFSAKLGATESKVDGFDSDFIALLNRLSAIKPPATPSAGSGASPSGS
jgi:hypothetical protein